MAIYKNGIKIDRAYKTSTRIDRIYKGSQLVFQNDTVITFYDLTVSGGTGSGKYESGTTVNVVADVAPSGYTFDVWTGDTSGITNVSASTTTLVMSATGVTVGSSYSEIFELIVNNGIGDGFYLPNSVVNISADTPPTSYIFDVWTGETTNITNVTASTTTLIMPSENVMVGSSYGLDPTSFYMVTTKQTNFSLSLTCSTYNTVTIDWGDGTTTLVNSNMKTHTWSSGGSHVVTVSGDLSKVTVIICNAQNLTELNLPSGLTNLSTLNCNSNQLTSLILPSGLITMNSLACSSNQLTSLILPSGLTTISVLNCFSNKLTNLTLPSGLTTLNSFQCYSNPNLTPPNISNLRTVDAMYFDRCGFNQSEVDNMISQALTISGFDTSCTFEVDNTTTGGVNNSTPSATGLANIATLRSRGWTVNHA